MSDNVVKNIVAIIFTLVCTMAYLSGYFSALRGWWFTILAMIVIYVAVIKLVDV